MCKYHVQCDGDPGFILHVEEPIHTGDYILYLNYRLQVLGKSFFIAEDGSCEVVLSTEEYIEEDEEEEEDEVDVLFPESGAECVGH